MVALPHAHVVLLVPARGPSGKRAAVVYLWLKYTTGAVCIKHTTGGSFTITLCIFFDGPFYPHR